MCPETTGLKQGNMAWMVYNMCRKGNNYNFISEASKVQVIWIFFKCKA